MFSFKLIQSGLDDLKKITRADFCLLAENNQIIANTFSDFQTDDVLMSFLESSAESQDVKGINYLKINGHSDEKYILVTHAGSGDGYMLSRIAASEISHLMEVSTKKADRDDLYRDIFSGQILYNDMLIRAEKLNIRTEAERVVYFISLEEEYKEQAKEILINMFSEESDDYVTVFNNSIVLVKCIDTEYTDEDIRVIADQIVSMINMELMAVNTVSFGGTARGLRDLYDSFRQARVTMEISRIFFPGRDVSSYDSLGIGRIIYGLTDEMCEMFLDEVYGEDRQRMPDNEETELANTFFENDLSIAEVVRVLNVPRSTLVYRLEKLYKKCGLDIRCFEDAITLKVAMMISKLKEQKRQ